MTLTHDSLLLVHPCRSRRVAGAPSVVVLVGSLLGEVARGSAFTVAEVKVFGFYRLSLEPSQKVAKVHQFLYTPGKGMVS